MLVLASGVCLWLDKIPSHTWYQNESKHTWLGNQPAAIVELDIASTSFCRQSAPVLFWLSVTSASSSKLRSHTLAMRRFLCRFLVGLAGNLTTYNAAKAALLSYHCLNMTVPHSDYNSLIRTQELKHWQLRWNSETHNKLNVIEPRMNVINLFRLSRQDDIIIENWTHISYLIRGETRHCYSAC